MKLLRVRHGNHIHPGVLVHETTIIDCRSFGEDWDEHFFASHGLERLARFLKAEQNKLPTFEYGKLELAAAVARPSKLICIGLNYAAHASESGMEPPSEPVVFFKATSAWCGPNDPIEIPSGSEKTDWEVELAVVIGQQAKRVSEAEALDYLAGYAVHNDYSERAWQMERGGQWVKGKSADTFAPFGPYLVTKDEISDPNNLKLWLDRNGERIQDSSTADFIFNVQQVVSYVSQFMTLLPGDVISTGTPAGVGLGMKPPQYLQPDDVIELGIEGLGSQRQVARPE